MTTNNHHLWNIDIAKALECEAMEYTIYKFHDPESERNYELQLIFRSDGYAGAEFWNAYLDYDNGEPDDWSQWLTPYLPGFYTYQDLIILKIDLIAGLRMRFPQVDGWNDDLHYDPATPMEIPYSSPLYPREFYEYFDFDLTNENDSFRLHTLGDVRLLRKAPLFKQRIAIIGSREPDPYGTEVAYRLGLYHSSEIVVSGLARGIDTAAHRGCLDGGGQTIAVVGSGLNHVHPKENANLQKEIIETGGLIVSEQEDNAKANPRTLIARTRIQMAMADKVIVVECDRESGTMHAVQYAQKFRKPVFALDCDWSGNRYLIDNKIAKPFTL